MKRLEEWSAYRGGQGVKALAELECPAIAGVTGEGFVATVSRQADRDMLAGHLGDVVRRDRGRIGERFVELPHQSGEELACL